MLPSSSNVRDVVTPTLSVVVAAHNAAAVIEDCLSALQKQTVLAICEVVVADSSSDGTDRIIRERFPGVTPLHFSEQLTVPQLRARAIARCQGDVIAILDPYSIVDCRWAEALVRQHQARPNLVIGGTVDLFEADRQDLLTWAQYLNEYGMFMPPMPEGAIEILAGSNISYKRAALDADGAVADDGFWKTFVNERAQTAGPALWLAPEVAVSVRKPVPFKNFLRTRFDHGRCYAGMRAAQGTPGGRWVRAVSAPALPAVFLWRWGRRFWPKKRYRRKFLSTLPLQLLLFGNWAYGEMIGYLRGPGLSCRKLFY